ncbi:MAG: hypothetical protein ACXW25_06320, partial [Rhodospirillales bacterium]
MKPRRSSPVKRASVERDLAGRSGDRPQLGRSVPIGRLRADVVVVVKAVDAVLVEVEGDAVERVRRLDADRRARA